MNLFASWGILESLGFFIGGSALRSALLPGLFELIQFLYFLDELFYVPERAVHGSESDICDVVHLLEFFHDPLADVGNADLFLRSLHKLLFDGVRNRFDTVYAYGSFFARPTHAFDNLPSVERFTTTILLYNIRKDFLYPFVRGKPFLTYETLTSSANYAIILAKSGVDDSVVDSAAGRTFHY